jgi:putative ABC transport system permease protein
MDTVLSDVRYALRVLWRNPGFTAVAVVTLALGIGANTTMFGVVNATLLRPLSFPAPERLVVLWESRVDDPESFNIASWPNFRDWREQSRSFESLALFDSAGRGYNLGGTGEPEQVSGVRVTASFFRTLGVQPMLGRGFLPDEETAGRDRVVVLSHGLWTRRYGADETLVGKTVKIDGTDFTVVGVMPPQFAFQFWSGPRELWVPAGYTEGDQSRGSHSFVAFGRIKAGVTFAQAQAEMNTIGRRLSEQYPADNIGGTVRLQPMGEVGATGVRTALLTLLGVVGFVLLIACVNVANLMLARAAVRHKELAVRCAMGAGRGRIVRQLLTESVILGLLGGVAGLVIAVWTTSLLPSILPGSVRFIPLRPIRQIGVDGTVLAFTFGVSCLTGILFGLAPAVAAFRGNLNETLKDTARGSTQGAKGRLRHVLVAAEVAMTLVVLAGAGLMMASVSRLLGVDPGLDPKNVLVMEMSLPQVDLYYGPPVHERFCDELQEQVGSLPGVVTVSTIGHLPLSGGNAGRGLTVEGRPDPGPRNQPGASYSVACPNILKTLGIGLVAGREFTTQDRLGAPGVILVNEALARKLWPDEDALGKRVKIGSFDSDAPWLTVVGISRDVRTAGLAEAPRPTFWRPYSQAAWPFVSVVVKTAAAPRTMVEPVKKALLRVEPNQAVAGVRTMEEVVSGSIGSRRFPMLLLSAFAGLALALAAVGIAGVVGYSVVQRTQEIGIRMALGAESRDVLNLVVGGSLAWALGGVGAGVLLSFAALSPLQSLLYGVGSTDPLVLVGVSMVLMAVAAAASYLPARRAARVDPVVALRCE